MKRGKCKILSKPLEYVAKYTDKLLSIRKVYRCEIVIAFRPRNITKLSEKYVIFNICFYARTPQYK